MQYQTDSGIFNAIHHNYEGTTAVFNVVGYKDPDGNTMSWSFLWQTSQLDSCASISWSGQTQYLANGDAVILTTWVLTIQTSSENNWDSTRIGTDQFHILDNPPPQCEDTAAMFMISINMDLKSAAVKPAAILKLN